jgi:hypothetical protein
MKSVILTPRSACVHDDLPPTRCVYTTSGLRLVPSHTTNREDVRFVSGSQFVVQTDYKYIRKVLRVLFAFGVGN